MEIKSEGECVCFDGWIFREGIDVNLFEIFGGWMQNM